MPLPPVTRLTEIQTQCVERWHREPIANPFDERSDFGFEKLVCQQHEFNFRLWHEEDVARSPNATDERIAAVKRAIDQLNQQRNDLIEQLDDAVAEALIADGIKSSPSMSVNTETPGSAIDRLSIMALRLFHYREQADRPGTNDHHRSMVQSRIKLCRAQHADLSKSLQELLDDLFACRKQHKTYRQMKMYNDASLNPEIYKASS